MAGAAPAMLVQLVHGKSGTNRSASLCWHFQASKEGWHDILDGAPEALCNCCCVAGTVQLLLCCRHCATAAVLPLPLDILDPLPEGGF
jgi:hypothetical protein